MVLPTDSNSACHRDTRRPVASAHYRTIPELYYSTDIGNLEEDEENQDYM